MAKKLKDVVKINPEPARGTNYVNPGQLGQYSAQNQVAEGGSLDQYLKSRGINAEVLSKDTKISHAKSNNFKKWRQDHKFESVEYVNEDAMLDQYLKSRGINPQYAPKNTKIAHSKSAQFLAWKKQHMHESVTKKPTALDKFRQDSAERQKKHDEIEKNQSKTGEGMTSAIDRLEKHLNKEENELAKKAAKYDWSKRMPKQKKPIQHYGQIELQKKQLNKEKMVDEMDKSQKGSAGWNLDDYDYSKGKWSEGKPVKVKDAKKDFKSILDKAFRPNHKSVKENTLDPNAATEAPADGANGGNEIADPNAKKPRSKLLSKIKSICQPVKEEIYDWEKDDKDQTSPGKKTSKNPKMEKEDPNALPDGEPKARAVMSGGKTLTGEPRDTIEIDPQMKARPDLMGNKKDDQVNKKVENK